MWGTQNSNNNDGLWLNIYIYTPYICISIVQNTFHIIKPMLCLYCLKILWTSSKTLLRSYQGHKATFNTLICWVSNPWTMCRRRAGEKLVLSRGARSQAPEEPNIAPFNDSAKLSTYPLIVDPNTTSAPWPPNHWFSCQESLFWMITWWGWWH